MSGTNPLSNTGIQVAAVVKTLTLPTSENSCFAYIAIEFLLVKTNRQYLKGERDGEKTSYMPFHIASRVLLKTNCE